MLTILKVSPALIDHRGKPGGRGPLRTVNTSTRHSIEKDVTAQTNTQINSAVTPSFSPSLSLFLSSGPVFLLGQNSSRSLLNPYLLPPLCRNVIRPVECANVIAIDQVAHAYRMGDPSI